LTLSQAAETEGRPLAFDPSGRYLAAATTDFHVQVWDLHRVGIVPTAVLSNSGRVSQVTFSPSGDLLASSSQDGTIRLWDAGRFTAPPVVLSGHARAVNAIAFSPGGQQLAAGAEDGSVNLWSWAGGQTKRMALEGHKGPVHDLAFSSDGDWLATGSYDTTVHLWNLRNLSQPPRRLEHDGSVAQLRFSPNGRWLATVALEHNIRLWDLAFGSSLLLLSDDATRYTRNVQGPPYPGTEPAFLDFHDNLIFSADNRWLAAAAPWDEVLVWDLSNLGAAPWALTDHTEAITGLAISGDSEWLATTTDMDNEVRLYRLADLSQPAIVLTTASDPMLFSPDGRWLATMAYGDSALLLWTWRLDDLILLGCRIAVRNLSEREWTRYLPGQPYRKTCPDAADNADSGGWRPAVGQPPSPLLYPVLPGSPPALPAASEPFAAPVSPLPPASPLPFPPQPASPLPPP
jgi:WD40 repeat protein